ncbi:MAG: rhodanese-like domain-containing protein [Gammaproteobacteria bacterium]|nr:rhodanese-like domain-containing protein [Gammaproteobacteria bacterium]MDH5727790.1 rhodanese-like domain-containing protein [Gammaproteobacteria bacterium]
MSQVKSISAKQAWDLLQTQPQAILVDVRSSMEYLFVGHAKGAISIPWIDEPDWKIDPHFATHIRQLMLGGVSCSEDGCVPILLICRSGKRSLEAGEKLIEDGFQDVYNIEHGFEGSLDEMHHRSTVNGWRFDALPWEQC